MVHLFTAAITALDQDEYAKTYENLTERYQAAEEKLNTLLAERKRMEAESLAISGMLFELMELEQLPIGFDEKLWNATVERLTVYDDGFSLFQKSVVNYCPYGVAVVCLNVASDTNHSLVKHEVALL